MTAEKQTTMVIGWRVYGLGVMAVGMLCLAWGTFDPGQPVPKDLPDRTAVRGVWVRLITMGAGFVAA